MLFAEEEGRERGRGVRQLEYSWEGWSCKSVSIASNITRSGQCPYCVLTFLYRLDSMIVLLIHPCCSSVLYPSTHSNKILQSNLTNHSNRRGHTISSSNSSSSVYSPALTSSLLLFFPLLYLIALSYIFFVIFVLSDPIVIQTRVRGMLVVLGL